jgi:hypothetical protein
LTQERTFAPVTRLLKTYRFRAFEALCISGAGCERGSSP